MTKTIILAAGYGTRLHKDIESYLSTHTNQPNDASSNSSDESITTKKEEYTLIQSLQNLSKPLLPLAKKPLISHWLDSLQNSHVCSKDCVYLVTNSQYYEQFLSWARENGIPEENVLDNGTTCNETRKGAIMDLKLILEYMMKPHGRDGDEDLAECYDENKEGLIVLGGDTLFDRRFKLKHVQQEMSHWDLLVLSYQLNQSEKVNEKGIIELGQENKSVSPELCQVRKITKFLEKPSEDETDSRTASPCFYALPRKAHTFLEKYLTLVDERHTNEEESLRQRDAPGHFVKYMVEHANVGALAIEQRFDVGRLDQFFEANNYFVNQERAAEEE